MMTVKQMIEVLQAAEAGKCIEWRHCDSKTGRWETILTSLNSWNFPCCEYRVRQEPRVIYINEFSGREGKDLNSQHYSSLEEAKACGKTAKSLKFVEVID